MYVVCIYLAADMLTTGNVEIARRVCKALSTAGAGPVDEDEACELLCAMQV